MSNAFDPYHTWLGISPAEQPPNHYRLLGVAMFEDSRDVISNAADRQMAHIRTFQSGKHSAESQKLLNELSAARVTLLDPKKRAAYDAKLRATMYPPAGMAPGPYPMGMAPQMPQAPMGMGAVPVQPVPVKPMTGQPVPVQPVPIQPMTGQPVPVQPVPVQPMTGQPVPVQPVPVRPMPGQPIPVQPMPVQPIQVQQPIVHTIKKRTQSKQDSTKLYLIIGIAVAALLALVVMLSSGSKPDPEIIVQTEAKTENSGAINPEDFKLGDDDDNVEELPERPVQEDLLNDSTPSQKPHHSPRKSRRTPTAEENTPQADESEKALEKVPEVKEEITDETKEESTEDSTSEGEETEKTEEKEDSETTQNAEEKDEKPEEAKAETADSGITDTEIKNLGSGASLWLEPKRDKMLKFYGADEQLLSKITEAVDWLNDKMFKNIKQKIVCWNFDHASVKKGVATKKFQNSGLAKQNLISATSLSLMAILGSGQIDPKEKANYSKAVYFLMANAKPAGEEQILRADYETAKKQEASLVIEENAVKDFHPHAWGITAVCNYIAVTQAMNDRREKHLAEYTEFAQALIRHLSRQQNTDGGFPAEERGLTIDYTLAASKHENESSIISTVWNLLALHAAKEAGISVPRDVIGNANNYLNGKISRFENRLRNHTEMSKSDLNEARVALFGIQLFGDDFPPYSESAYVLEQILAQYDESQLQENFFSTMYARDLRGDSWKNWREKVTTPYLKAQSSNKIEKGSWYFTGETVNDEGGRLYCTAMTALILESFYHISPTRPLDEWNSPDSVQNTGNHTSTVEEEYETPKESFMENGKSLELSSGDDDDDDDDDDEN